MSLEHHSIYGVLVFTLTRRNFSKKPAHDKYDGTTMMKKKKQQQKQQKTYAMIVPHLISFISFRLRNLTLASC